MSATSSKNFAGRINLRRGAAVYTKPLVQYTIAMTPSNCWIMHDATAPYNFSTQTPIEAVPRAAYKHALITATKCDRSPFSDSKPTRSTIASGEHAFPSGRQHVLENASTLHLSSPLALTYHLAPRGWCVSGSEALSQESAVPSVTLD